MLTPDLQPYNGTPFDKLYRTEPYFVNKRCFFMQEWTAQHITVSPVGKESTEYTIVLVSFHFLSPLSLSLAFFRCSFFSFKYVTSTWLRPSQRRSSAITVNERLKPDDILSMTGCTVMTSCHDSAHCHSECILSYWQRPHLYFKLSIKELKDVIRIRF